MFSSQKQVAWYDACRNNGFWWVNDYACYFAQYHSEIFHFQVQGLTDAKYSVKIGNAEYVFAGNEPSQKIRIVGKYNKYIARKELAASLQFLFAYLVYEQSFFPTSVIYFLL